jgi:hypothetical protein
MRQHHEHKENPEGRRRHYEEVDGGHLFHMTGQESSPGLGGWLPRAAKIFGHGRLFSGAMRSRYRGERCADYNANRATIAKARPTRIGRSAGGASAAAGSFGKPRAGDEARGSPPAGRYEFESWRRQERKGRRKESSS